MNIRIHTHEAIKYAGNKARLAKLLNITRQAVQNWGDEVPQTSAFKLYLISDKEIGSLIK